MSSKEKEERKFLGRSFDSNRRVWVYSDGSGGAIPDECRIEVESFVEMGAGSWLAAFETIKGYKRRLWLLHEPETAQSNAGSATQTTPIV